MVPGLNEKEKDNTHFIPSVIEFFFKKKKLLFQTWKIKPKQDNIPMDVSMSTNFIFYFLIVLACLTCLSSILDMDKVIRFHYLYVVYNFLQHHFPLKNC